MDGNCWKVIGLAGTVVLGLVTAIKILWGAYQRSLARERDLQVKLLSSKDEHVHEMEAFKKIVEDLIHGR